MKKWLLRLVGVLVVLSIAGLVLIQIPAVQDRLMSRVIAERMGTVPEDLFKDDALRVVVCGSAAPMPIKDRAAACVMVIAGGKFYIVDTGNRSTNNLGLWRIPVQRLGAVFLTHFHSDHIGDLGEFNMMTWAQGRPAPLDVYGPEGVEQVVEGFSIAYALDSSYRTAHHGADYLNPEKGRMIAHEVALGEGLVPVLEQDGLKVSMFIVDHKPIAPAVGYRFDYKGRSVVVSGDTVADENLIAAAKNADVLLHEVLARDMVKQMENTARNLGIKQLAKVMFDIQDYHTSPVEAAEVANKANVRELVLYHLVPTPPNRIAEKVFMRGVKDVRPKGVTLGHDGLTLTLPIGSSEITQQCLDSRQ
jgi:ribonuclease Z